MAKSRTTAKPTRTHRGSTTGKYMSAEQTGRYTRPISKETRHSPRWFGFLVVGLLVVGAFLLVGDYLSFLPGAVSPYYLVAGLVCIVAGFVFATRFR